MLSEWTGGMSSSKPRERSALPPVRGPPCLAPRDLTQPTASPSEIQSRGQPQAALLPMSTKPRPTVTTRLVVVIYGNVLSGIEQRNTWGNKSEG
jgi:hypothetical protein